MTISAPPLSEKAWQRTVVDAAALYRWASYHTFDSRRSNPGWPDLVLCRPPELLVVELKTARGRVSGVQREWLDRLAACGVEVAVWRPQDWPAVVQRLKPKQQPSGRRSTQLADPQRAVEGYPTRVLAAILQAPPAGFEPATNAPYEGAALSRLSYEGMCGVAGTHSPKGVPAASLVGKRGVRCLSHRLFSLRRTVVVRSVCTSRAGGSLFSCRDCGPARMPGPRAGSALARAIHCAYGPGGNPALPPKMGGNVVLNAPARGAEMRIRRRGSPCPRSQRRVPTAFRQSKRQTLLDPQTERKQLSFSLGIVGAPDRASLKISGKMPVARDLRYHERVHVRVTDMDGNVLTSYEGNVDDVRFPTKRDEFGDVASITREHTVTLG